MSPVDFSNRAHELRGDGAADTLCPIGDPLFLGEPSKVFSRRLSEFEASLTEEHKVVISKKVGFEPPKAGTIT